MQARTWWNRIAASAILLAIVALPVRAQEPLPGTEPLTWEGDLASRMVDGIDRFLLRELDRSIEQRQRWWQRDTSSEIAYNASVAENRQALRDMLGLVDDRVAYDGPQILTTTASRVASLAENPDFIVFAISWPVVRDVRAEGLLLVPNNRPHLANVVALPDADVTPEAIAGFGENPTGTAAYARRLAEARCRVVIPTLISRERTARNGRAVLTNREYLYRSGFELGRHLIGHEVQTVLAAVDWFESSSDDPIPTCVVGWGEGGSIALYAAAADLRIDAACVSGYFDSRQDLWRQPIDRNVFGLLDQFGDAELASLIAPRPLIVEAARGPELEIPGEGGAPARLVSPENASVQREVRRARELTEGLDDWLTLVEPEGAALEDETLDKMLESTGIRVPRTPPARPPRRHRDDPTPADRQARLVHQWDDHQQWLLRESPYVRRDFMSQLDTSSLESFQETIEPYREIFRHDVIGQFDHELMPPSPRTRRVYAGDGWTGYEVVLDVFPDVFAYGILLVPDGIAEGEQRPVVVCQHGLEGRPQDVIQGDHRAYHDFAAALAERGFITFAPQNLYIFGDRFRTLQRKANPLGKTLFSIMVPQHQQIVNWLSSLPQVDPDRIAFYGLSYGGKSAMRIPPLVPEYCLSICSADFNDWVWKNASTRARYSYVWTGEYEIFEWNLGGTFNYSEMAALIAPRPFMVERGHFDGVAPDERVAYEFAKVRYLYQSQLGIGERCEIEWFVGPHTINGEATFAFLHRWLDWPEPGSRAP